MAKKSAASKTSKTQEIVNCLDSGMSSPKEIAEHLSEMGIVVSPQYVSTIKHLKRRTGQLATGSIEDLESVSVADMAVLSELIRKKYAGSFERALKAFQALQLLQQ